MTEVDCFQTGRIINVVIMFYISVFGHLFHPLHLWDVELQHVLDAVLQRDDGTGAAGARALELQLHDAVLETPIEHVAPVLLHRGPGRGRKPHLYKDCSIKQATFK